MSPKRRPDKVIVHRIELQEHEREALDALIAANTVRNVAGAVGSVGGAVGSVITPILGASVAGLVAWGATMAFIESYLAEREISKITVPISHGGTGGPTDISVGSGGFSRNPLSGEPYTAADVTAADPSRAPTFTTKFIAGLSAFQYALRNAIQQSGDILDTD